DGGSEISRYPTHLPRTSLRRLHIAPAREISSTVLRPHPGIRRRKGRIRASDLTRSTLRAPAERQHDKERGEPLLQDQHGSAAHSMTSSARASSNGGTVRPRALAVFRLMTSSNRVACSTGTSAGCSPLRILSMMCAQRWYISAILGP